MKRDFLKDLGIEDTVIDKIMSANGADIEKAKAGSTKLQEELDAANTALTQAKSTITELEAHKGDVDALQKKLDEYKAADQKREQEAKEAQEAAELERRFNLVSGERKYIHDMVRAGVLHDFGEALKSKDNVGKGDAEIFAALTKDKGYFANQNPPGSPFKPMGNPDPINVTDKASFFKLSFADQTRFKNENPEVFKQLFHAPTNPIS